MAASKVYSGVRYSRCQYQDGSPVTAHGQGTSRVTLGRQSRIPQCKWKDAEAVRLLYHCRTAIIPDGKLLVIEMTIPDDNPPSPGCYVC